MVTPRLSSTPPISIIITIPTMVLFCLASNSRFIFFNILSIVVSLTVITFAYFSIPDIFMQTTGLLSDLFILSVKLRSFITVHKIFP